ncbi:la-related protein 1A-like [Mangifera indica]|uniref:la-related protein 1A-like n=1 Tax=Mangifera indica TaxID=29780 RepID=UPI001CFBB90F|nr:la-related protein 1A-like [Mangifera indica]
MAQRNLDMPIPFPYQSQLHSVANQQPYCAHPTLVQPFVHVPLVDAVDTVGRIYQGFYVGDLGCGYTLVPGFPTQALNYVSPYLAPHMNPAATMPPAALKDSVRKQIEYYFSDENLRDDPYLISLMDGQGWVAISNIAEFRRVKKMSTDISFILDALKSLTSVEVQGNLIRRQGV